MTVSYQYDVASSASGGFIRLLFRWRGSVWKVVYREMLLFTVCYIVLSLLYNFALTEGQQRIFEKVVFFCSTFMDLIPLSFMLGFYVSFIAARWWSQFIAIPWPDK
ncbi:bestrophin-1 [Trichonephila clavata]|uniref:Bestrophin homolog n=1 Tax=Trichonephila clavata TaxID=2740835 RepID=A0A8X6KEJ0_TRICU|nr:bestrophin-1 [Trichonephila clavata]